MTLMPKQIPMPYHSKLPLLAPGESLSNETRALDWAIRMMSAISHAMGWEFSELPNNTWRIRLPALKFDILIAKTPAQLIKKADDFYRSYKIIQSTDPEKILNPLSVVPDKEEPCSSTS